MELVDKDDKTVLRVILHTFKVVEENICMTRREMEDIKKELRSILLSL